MWYEFWIENSTEYKSFSFEIQAREVWKHSNPVLPISQLLCLRRHGNVLFENVEISNSSDLKKFWLLHIPIRYRAFARQNAHIFLKFEFLSFHFIWQKSDVYLCRLFPDKRSSSIFINRRSIRIFMLSRVSNLKNVDFFCQFGIFRILQTEMSFITW